MNHPFLVGFSTGIIIFRYLVKWIQNIRFYTNFTKRLAEDPDCCICYEPLKDKHVIRCNQCYKMFDIECVTNWLKTGKYCPCCRNNWEYEYDYTSTSTPFLDH